jgi:hypothetical protein
MIAPPYQRAVPLLASQFEGRLEEVHEQPGTLVEASQRRRRVKPAQAAIAGQTPHHRAVFLLDPGLIVLAVGAGAGPMEFLLAAVGL